MRLGKQTGLTLSAWQRKFLTSKILYSKQAIAENDLSGLAEINVEDISLN